MLDLKIVGATVLWLVFGILLRLCGFRSKLPKIGSAQPSGSNSGGCSNHAFNGPTTAFSASAKGKHSSNRIAATIESWLTSKIFLPRRPYRRP